MLIVKVNTIFLKVDWMINLAIIEQNRIEYIFSVPHSSDYGDTELHTFIF